MVEADIPKLSGYSGTCSAVLHFQLPCLCFENSENAFIKLRHFLSIGYKYAILCLFLIQRFPAVQRFQYAGICVIIVTRPRRVDVKTEPR